MIIFLVLEVSLLFYLILIISKEKESKKKGKHFFSKSILLFEKKFERIKKKLVWLNIFIYFHYLR